MLSSGIDSAMDLPGSDEVMKKEQATHTKAGANWAGLSTGKIAALGMFSKFTTNCWTERWDYCIQMNEKAMLFHTDKQGVRVCSVCATGRRQQAELVSVGAIFVGSLPTRGRKMWWELSTFKLRTNSAGFAISQPRLEKPLYFPWVWGLGILYMPMSTTFTKGLLFSLQFLLIASDYPFWYFQGSLKLSNSRTLL